MDAFFIGSKTPQAKTKKENNNGERPSDKCPFFKGYIWNPTNKGASYAISNSKTMIAITSEIPRMTFKILFNILSSLEVQIQITFPVKSKYYRYIDNIYYITLRFANTLINTFFIVLKIGYRLFPRDRVLYTLLIAI